MGESKLKPCPFCGSTNLGRLMSRDKVYTVSCMDCGATGPEFDGEVESSEAYEETARRWNCRASTWLLIETAPKDRNTAILVTWSKTGDITRALDIATWRDGGFGYLYWPPEKTYDIQPTHWMPIPDIPKEW